MRHTEGLTRGFLVLRTLDGNSIADGDLTQIARGGRVTDHLVFHFKDGSVYDETSVFTQRGTFRLVRNHLVQKGPSFKRSMETSLDAATDQVTSRYTDDDGKEKIVTERLKLPSDLANGMIPLAISSKFSNSRASCSAELLTTDFILVNIVLYIGRSRWRVRNSTPSADIGPRSP